MTPHERMAAYAALPIQQKMALRAKARQAYANLPPHQKAVVAGKLQERKSLLQSQSMALATQPPAQTATTGGFFDALTVKAADTGGKRLAKELGMFALLTSPAWLLLLMLRKPERERY